MANLTDVKQTMRTLIQYIPSNINYLKNLLTSVNNVSYTKLYDLDFELETSIDIVYGFVDLTMRVHDITSAELHIFFSEFNSQMIKYINDGLDFSNILEEMVFITVMLIELYEMMGFFRDGSFLDDNISVDMLHSFMGYISKYIRDSEKMLELLQEHYKMINI